EFVVFVAVESANGEHSFIIKYVKICCQTDSKSVGFDSVMDELFVDNELCT
ncbi:unnamed protein product, partial [Rotaria socialis]